MVFKLIHIQSSPQLIKLHTHTHPLIQTCTSLFYFLTMMLMFSPKQGRRKQIATITYKKQSNNNNTTIVNRLLKSINKAYNIKHNNITTNRKQINNHDRQQ